MKIIKTRFIAGLFMAITLTSAFAQNREELNASALEKDSVKSEKVANDSVKLQMKVCEMDEKANIKNSTKERVLFRHKLSEFI